MITVTRNEQEVFPSTRFPNGEIGFELEKHCSAAVRWQYEGDHELLHLKMLADHIGPFFLEIDYLPYSRMDRVKGDWAFTLKSVCDLINSLECRVWVSEPHSDVCMGLLDNARALYPTSLIFDKVCEEIGFEKGKDYIVFPDAGAEKRYADMYPGHRYLIGYKNRDFNTGEIKSFELINPIDEYVDTGDKAIIIDDLCSKGGTFEATANILYDKFGFEDVTLLVAHLESSVHKGSMIDNPVIKRIYATNSIYAPPGLYGLKPHPKIHIYDWRKSELSSHATV